MQNEKYPSKEQFAALLERNQDKKPITMVNLLKFKPKATYKDDPSSKLTGKEAYNIYGAGVQKIIEKMGGRKLFSGNVKGLVLGTVPAAQMWDAIMIVQYPSAEAFAKMQTMPEFLELARHRAAGLDGQLLIETDQNYESKL